MSTKEETMSSAGLGLVGLGNWGSNLAGKLDAIDGNLVSCYSRSEESRSEFALEHACRAAGSVEEMLADPDVGAVLFATPHSTHSDFVIQAAEAGKHVFVDKPFTLTVAAGKRALAAAEAAGIVLQVGHNRRRQPANRRLKKMVENGDLGVVHYAEANLSYPKGLNPRSGWRGDPTESPAGGMTGLGVHMADNLNYLFGRATRVAAFSKKIIGLSDLDDVTTATIEYSDGPLAILGTSMVIPDIGRTAVWGTKGAARNDEDGARFLTQEVGSWDWVEQEIDVLDTVRDELEEFISNVRDGTKPETGGIEGLEATVILEGIVESAARGTVVDLDEIRARD
jgi:predicted dehydrogenase